MNVLTQFLKKIADRLRKYLGTSDPIKASSFADKIDEVYDHGYSAANTDFWKNFQKFEASTNTALRKSYTQGFANWGAKEIKPFYAISNASPDTRYMFYACTGLTSTDDLDFSEWTWSGLGNSISMFQYCDHLESLDWGAQFKFSPINISNMFDGCSKLHTLINFDVSQIKGQGAANAFKNCTSLKNISFNGTHFKVDESNLIIDFSACGDLSGESVNNIVKAACPYSSNAVPDEVVNTVKSIILPSTAPTSWANYMGIQKTDLIYDWLSSNGWTVILA